MYLLSFECYFLEEVLIVPMTCMEHCDSIAVDEKHVACAFQRLILKTCGLKMDDVDEGEHEDDEIEKNHNQSALTV